MILVSCCNENGGIFGINETTLQAHRIIDHEARGMVVDNGFVFVATHDGIHLYKAVQPRDWLLIASHRAKHNWHGVAIKDAIVYCAVSQHGTILCFDKLLNQYIPERYDWPTGKPNDLCFYRDDLYYCLPSPGKIMKWPVPEPIMQGLVMPHSLIVTARDIYTCNSNIGQVIKFSKYLENNHFAEGNFESIIKVAEYTRGLHLEKSHLWIGLSTHRRSAKEKYRCGVIRKNLKTGHEDFVALPADEVYCITKM